MNNVLYVMQRRRFGLLVGSEGDGSTYIMIHHNDNNNAVIIIIMCPQCTALQAVRAGSLTWVGLCSYHK